MYHLLLRHCCPYWSACRLLGQCGHRQWCDGREYWSRCFGKVMRETLGFRVWSPDEVQCMLPLSYWASAPSSLALCPSLAHIDFRSRPGVILYESLTHQLIISTNPHFSTFLSLQSFTVVVWQSKCKIPWLMDARGNGNGKGWDTGATTRLQRGGWIPFTKLPLERGQRLDNILWYWILETFGVIPIYCVRMYGH